MSIESHPNDNARTAGGERTAARLGVLAALPQELGDLIDAMRAEGEMRTVTLGRRDYHIGTAYGVPCVVTLARVGKVAAAATASALIHVFGVHSMVFTGVAGGVGAGVRVGDIVVADTLLQHDMDASPLFPRYEVPLLERAHFSAHAPLSDRLAAACERFVAEQGPVLAERFVFEHPRVHRGLIVSGDRFVSSAAEVRALSGALPEAMAVEMEGAAMAQVCYEHGVPCAIVRTISDTADDHATASFTTFLTDIAGTYSSGVLALFLREYAAAERVGA
ncbi:5'-methylthioadenosine/adenosylhomocysteine nucleosidase [Trinickia soli]|uniref:5'-methylthioadenosine/adenosylhomocysteine nucleosidase n=1 Tax=Trinickia soli TaxID=380675 RepID=UPI00125BEF16|nr:5'-methylthioadenosine/adenosylhomocysteine nucleosidase [Paraburkholderia sp. T12-10]